MTLAQVLYKLFIALLFILSLPVQFFIIILVAISTGFPVIFQQKRVGLDGGTFKLYKIRTMTVGAEKIQKIYRRRNEADGPVFKIYGDPRYTSIGKFLAHTGLDELPQLYNVLHGDMALFGPRPLPINEERFLLSWQKQREMVLPGIISPAIIHGRYHSDFEAWVRSDIAYAKRKNMRTDTKLFFETFLFMGKLFAYTVRKTLINKA